MHLIATNYYGGPEKQIIEHLGRLNRSSHYFGVLASFLEGKKPNEILERAKTAGLKQYGIPMSNPIDFTALLKLIKILRKEKVDLLCTHGFKSTVTGWWACRKVRIPVIAFSRGYTAENIKISFYEWLERRVLRSMNGVICVSEGQKCQLNTFGIYNTMSWVVHNAVSINKNNKNLSRIDKDLRQSVFNRLGLSNNSTMVVSAGRLSPEKGHCFLIEAISMLGKNANDTYFVFCGEGVCKKELERQAQKLKVADRCRFVGFRRDLDEIFRVMDFMILPSLTEGLPNVVLEAFANKKTVVATAVGGVPEIVEDGVNGILVPPGHSELLAEGIETLLASRELRITMGEVGYHKVKTSFSFKKQSQKLEEIYRLILN